MSITLKEFEKVGFDTGVFVNLALKSINLYKFKEKEFLAKNLFYYAKQTKYEFTGVMINKFNISKKEKNYGKA